MKDIPEASTAGLDNSFAVGVKIPKVKDAEYWRKIARENTAVYLRSPDGNLIGCVRGCRTLDECKQN